MRSKMQAVTGNWLDDYRRWLLARGCRPKTVAQRMKVLRHAERDLGPLPDAEAWQMTDWLALPHAPETRAHYRSALRSWCAWAVDHGYTARDEADRLPPVRVPRHLPRPVPDDDLDRMLDAAEGRVRAYVLLMAWCGLRSAEVAGVRREHMVRSGDGWQLRVVEPKGGGEQSVPMPGWVADEVRSLPLADGRSADSVRQAVARLMRRVGAAGTPHSLRHWYGTTLLRSTGNLRVVQQCLRHASLATTAVYTLVVDDETRAAAESLPHRPRLHVA